MAVKFSNNFSTSLAVAASSTATTLELASVTGLPTLGSGDYTYLTIDTDTVSPTIEVVKVTAVNTGTNEITVTRGQDNTTASAFDAGTKVELRLTSILLNDVSDEASVTLWADIQNKPDSVITLAGDASGSATMTDLGSATLTVTIADDSHNHVISNVDGLQTALDAKQDASTALTTSNYSTTLDGRYYTETEIGTFFSGSSAITGYNKTNWDTAYGWGDHSVEGYLTGNQTITLTGDVSGSGTTSIAVTIADDSHNHVISNVDGLQTALDAKQDASTALTTSTSFGGDVSGTYNAIVIADDSHNHVISNVDGLQTALDGKVDLAGDTMTGNLGIGISPTNRLHVYHPTTNVVARFESGDTEVWIDLHDSDSGTYGALLGHTSTELFKVADASVNVRMSLDNNGLLDTDAGYSVGGTTVINSSTVGSLSQLNVISSSTPTINIYDNGNGSGGGASGKIIFQNTDGDAIGIGYTGDSTADSDLIISTNAGGTYGGYLGLDAVAIADTKADIILEPLSQVLVSSAPLKISNSVFGEHLILHREDATNSSSIKFTNTAGTAGILYGRQSDNELVWRDGTSTNNFMIWHQGNDGSGSGLDADLLDGIGGGSFLRSDTSDDFTGGYLRFNDNSVLRFGDGSDFRIYHNGTDTVFRNYKHGSNTYIQGEDTAGNNHAMIYLRQDTTEPYVQMFGDGSETFRTKAGGVKVTGQAEAPVIFINRQNNQTSGINWYSATYKAWSMYMAPPGASMGPNGNITAPSGTLVTSWAQRSFIENASGYGWTFESGVNTGNPTVRAEIRASDGAARFGGVVNSVGGYDINGTTVISSGRAALNLQRVSLDASHGNGYNFWDGNGAYVIYMSQATNGTYGGRVNGETTSDYNMYFKMQSGTNRGFVFRDDGNNFFSINPNSGIHSEVPAFWQNYIRMEKTGTATSSTTSFPSEEMVFRSSGWDTNNTVARNCDWHVRAEATPSAYPDQHLSFYEQLPSYGHKKFELHGRNSGASYQHPDAATFYGNVDIAQTSDSTGGELRIGGTAVINTSRYGLFDRVYVGSGSNDGFFYADQNGRTAFSSGDFYITSSVGNFYNYATNQYYGGTSGDNLYYRGNTLTGNSWSMTGGGVLTISGVIRRNAHNVGHLEGGHNNLGSTATRTSPIYTIGSSYNPNVSTLGNMYGIGYTHTNASFIGFAGSSGWGMYVAADGDARVYLSGQSGSGHFTGNITAYASDRRLKKNIQTIDRALEKVSRIRGVEFDWVDDITTEYDFHPEQMHETGVIAQEIQSVIEDAVVEAPMNANYAAKSGTDHKFLTVDKSKIVPLLIEAIKELKAEVDDLKAQLKGG